MESTRKARLSEVKSLTRNQIHLSTGILRLDNSDLEETG